MNRADSSDPPLNLNRADWAEEVLVSYDGLLRGLVGRRCPPSIASQIDDIRQDARLRLWRALQSEREIRSPSSYLYRVAVTATLDALKAARARREEPLGDDTFSSAPGGPSAEESADHRARVARVQAAMEALPERTRQAVALRLRGFTTDEIGGILGWSEAKARNIVYRGLEQLRRRLAEHGGDDEPI